MQRPVRIPRNTVWLLLELFLAGGIVLIATASSFAAGTLLWSDRFGLADGTELANAVDAEGRRVFAAGGSRNASGENRFLVRAYDAKTGSLVWQNETIRDGFATVVLADRSAVFVAGIGLGLTAYDPATGALLWEAQSEIADGLSIVSSMAAHETVLFVAGATQKPTPDFDFDFFIRAYDMQSGILLWEDLVDKSGRDDNATSIAVTSRRVFVVGWSTNAGPLPPGGEASGRDAGNTDVLIRAYDAIDGTLLWEDVFDRADGDDFATSVVTKGRRVFVGGTTQNVDETAAGNFDVMLRSYSALTGELLWQVDFDSGPVDRVSDIAVEGSRLFVAGETQNAAGSADMLVQAYDAWTGAALWTDTFNRAEGDDWANAITVTARKVFVAGRVTDAEGNIDFIVQAYESRTGDLLWRDEFNVGRLDEARDIAARHGRVFAVGFVEDASENFDLVVRAYSVH